MSAPESSQLPGNASRVRCAGCPADIVEIAARRGQAAELVALASHRGWSLPAIGRSVAMSGRFVICVRPERWLLLSASDAPGASAAAWESATAGSAGIVDLSSGLTGFLLTGPAVRDALARGCRLDLDPTVFPAGHAAATIIAQVSVIIVALSSGMLLLTPSTTARHFSEWLAQVAAPFGFEAQPALPVAFLSGDPSS